MKPGDLVRINFSGFSLVDDTHQGKIAIITRSYSPRGSCITGIWWLLIGDVEETINHVYLEVLQ
jgi:hypothetical protein